MRRQLPNGEYKWLGIGVGNIRGTNIIVRSPGGPLVMSGRKAPMLNPMMNSKKGF